MKHKYYQLKSNRIVIALLIVFAILMITSVAIFVTRDHTEASSQPKSNTNKAVQSPFSFDASKAAGWYQGPANASSMAIFSNDQSCWVSLERKTGTVDEAAELQKSLATLTGSGYTVEQKDTLQFTLAATSGSKPYRLYQHDVSGQGSAGQLYGGQQLGYVQFSDGSVFIQGYCNTFAQLPAITPVLQAVKFNDTK